MKIRQVLLHDFPISAPLEFDRENKMIHLFYEKYNDIKCVYINRVITFKTVSNYHFEYPDKEYKDEMRSIYSAQIIPWENNQRKIVLLIDMPRIADDKEATVGKMEIIYSEMTNKLRYKPKNKV